MLVGIAGTFAGLGLAPEGHLAGQPALDRADGTFAGLTARERAHLKPVRTRSSPSCRRAARA